MESFKKALRLFDIDFVVITDGPFAQPVNEGSNQSEGEIAAEENAEVLSDDDTINSVSFDNEGVKSFNEMDQSPFPTIP